MSKSFYTLGKALSNFAVLGATILILAAEAIIIQWTRKEMGPVHFVDLLAPILVFGLSAVSLTAALAVLFETFQACAAEPETSPIFFSGASC